MRWLGRTSERKLEHDGKTERPEAPDQIELRMPKAASYVEQVIDSEAARPSQAKVARAERTMHARHPLATIMKRARIDHAASLHPSSRHSKFRFLSTQQASGLPAMSSMLIWCCLMRIY